MALLTVNTNLFIVDINLSRYFSNIWCIFVRASLYMPREENQLDTTEWQIALIICSPCFGLLHAHHQELESSWWWACKCPKHGEQIISTIHAHHQELEISWWWACKCPKHGEQITSAIHAHHQELESSWWACKCPNHGEQIISAIHAHHQELESSWWACKCPKHGEQIISAIHHSVVSSWFSSLRI